MKAEEHQQMVDLFLVAVDLSEEGRAAYLDRVCVDNPDLRSELVALLEHHDPNPLIRDDGPSSMVELLALPLRAVPDNRYEIRDEIARGGMGVILRARDNEIGREVAIKVLLDSLAASPEALTRFVAEAQIAGQLQHPGIAPVYELGELPDGRPFFAMELVDGESLARVLEQRSSAGSEKSRLLGIYEQICHTVAYAHSRGVIHRDLKPANVIVGAFGQVQVLDWGLAKVLSSSDADAPASNQTPRTVRAESTDTSGGNLLATRAAAGMGTRGYAPPEQSRGETSAVDRRSDVYSLGAILCEILTGEPAHDNGVAADKTLARLDRSGADVALVELVKECISPEPHDRPEDAFVVAQRVSDYQQSVQTRLQDAELASARAEARIDEERKRRVVTVALAISAVLLCLVGFAASAWITGEKHQREVERQRRENLVTQSINDALTDAIRLRELARAASMTSVEPWQRAVEAAERARAFTNEHTIAPDLQAKVSGTLTSLQIEAKNHRFFADIATARIQPDNVRLHHYNNELMAERFATAFHDYGIDADVMEPAEAASIVRSQGGEHLPEVIRIANQWWLFDPRGRKTQEAGRWVREFVDALDDDPWRRAWRDEIGRTRDNRDAMLALIRDPATLDRPLGDLVNLTQGMVRTRQPWVGEIIGFLQEAERRHPQSIWIKYWIADFTARMDSPELIQQGLRYSQTLVVLHPTSVNRVLHAKLLRKAGATEEAEAELQDVLTTHPHHVAALFGLAQIHASRSQWQHALDCLDAANAATGDSELGVAMRGRMYMTLGRFDEAAEIFETLANSTPREAFRHYQNLGEARLAMGRSNDAINAFQRVDPKDSKTWLLLSDAYLAIEDAKSAVSAAQYAVDAQPELALPHYKLGDALANEGRWADAVESYRQGLTRDPGGKENFYRLARASRTAVLAATREPDAAITTLDRDQLQHSAQMWLRLAVDHANAANDRSQLMAQLLDESDFANVRDDSKLAALQSHQRDAWTRIWQEVRGENPER